MNRISTFLIKSIYWMMLFLCPVFFLGGLGVILFINFDFHILSYSLVGLGILSGIALAEYVRVKVGDSEQISYPELFSLS